MLKQRITWVDTAKYICIIFVMMRHLESNTAFLSTLYTPFFLTVFFFVSGYVYNEKYTFSQFMYKKFRGLFIPWLIFSVFNILLSQIISFNRHGSLLTELGWNFLQIRGYGDGVWFVAALFVAFIPFYFIIRWGNKEPDKRQKIVLVLSFVLSILSVVYTILMDPTLLPWNSMELPWHMEYIYQAMFYMVLGYYFKTNYEIVFDKYNTKRNRIICWCVYLVMVYVPYYANVQLPTFINVAYQYACQFVGIIAIVSICKVININRYIEYVGQNTLIYFALHGKVYSLIQTVLRRFFSGIYGTVLSNVIGSSLFAVLFAFGLSVILIIPAYIINRWLPFVMGRETGNLVKIHRYRRNLH